MLNIVRIRCPVKWIRCQVKEIRCKVKCSGARQVVRISSRPAPGGTIDSAVRARTLTVSCEYWDWERATDDPDARRTGGLADRPGPGGARPPRVYHRRPGG